MTIARAGFALVWSPDGRIFAIGGLDDEQNPTSSVEMLDCPWDNEGKSRGDWMPVAPMNKNRRFHGACFFEGKIFAAGGKGEDSAECFVIPSVDIPMGQWTLIRPMNRKNDLQGLLPFDGSLLVVGELHNQYVARRPVGVSRLKKLLQQALNLKLISDFGNTNLLCDLQASQL